MCVTLVVFIDCESCTRTISTKPVIYGSGRVWANAWDLFHRTPSRSGRGRPAVVNFVVCFACGGSFRRRVGSFLFFERTRPAASMITPCLIYLSTSDKEPDVGAKQRRLSVSNGRLCAGACEIIPGTFAHSVGLLNKIILPLSLVCVR